MSTKYYENVNVIKEDFAEMSSKLLSILKVALRAGVQIVVVSDETGDNVKVILKDKKTKYSMITAEADTKEHALDIMCAILDSKDVE